MYAINLAADGRVLSASYRIPGIDYPGMITVDSLPEGDISDYRYVDGEYAYDPLPRRSPEESPTLEDRVEMLESDAAETREALEMILSVVTE